MRCGSRRARPYRRDGFEYGESRRNLPICTSSPYRLPVDVGAVEGTDVDDVEFVLSPTGTPRAGGSR